MPENTSFAFVANLLDVNCNLPFKVIENCYFQKADSIQTGIIKKHLLDSGYFSFGQCPYEVIWVEKNTEAQQNKEFTIQRLEQKDWKYYVINFQGNIGEIFNLSLAANLLEIELEFNLKFRSCDQKKSQEFGLIKNLTHAFNYFHEIEMTVPPFIEVIDDTTLQNLGIIYKNYQQLDEIKYPDIKKAINMLEDMKHLPHNSKFKVLGLFTIIEFLITHKPIDTGDSITRQVTNKINLLSKRFINQLDYSQSFGSTPESTIWKKLYSYRSKIAHGGQPDFAKELSVLKDDLTANKFLKLVVKMLLRHSLIEPQLYTDLREC